MNDIDDGVSAAAAEIVGVANCFLLGSHQPPPNRKENASNFLVGKRNVLKCKHILEDRLQMLINETDGNTKTKSAEPQTRCYFVLTEYNFSNRISCGLFIF